MIREEKLDWLYRLKSEIYTYMPITWIKPMANALRDAIKALEQEQEPTTKSDSLVSLEVYKQVAKERDIAIEQLHELGYEFGQKIEPTTKNDLVVDAISRSDARKAITDHQYSDSFCVEHNIDHSINTGMALIALTELPSVTPQLSSGLEKNSQKLENPTTTNDLGVDCVRRIEVIDYLCKHCPDDGECFKDCDEIKHLRQMPSVTPQPRKAHWIKEKIDAMSQSFGFAKYHCSNCSHIISGISIKETNFCPNCGADMREVEE